VWAWLLGPFIDAYFKVNGKGGKTRVQVREWLRVFSTHLIEAGLGHVSEIFDGDSPHHPRGCFAQAWSVGEILRAVVENEVMAEARKPKEPLPLPDGMDIGPNCEVEI
jgi:glycogen debranching enzyme